MAEAFSEHFISYVLLTLKILQFLKKGYLSMHWNKSNVKPRKYCVKINKNCNKWRGYHAKGLVGGISSSYSNMNMMKEWCTIDKPVGRQEGRVQWNSIVQMKIRSLKKEKGNKRHWIWWYSYYKLQSVIQTIS